MKQNKSICVVIRDKLLRDIIKRAIEEGFDYELHEFTRKLIQERLKELKGGLK